MKYLVAIVLLAFCSVYVHSYTVIRNNPDGTKSEFSIEDIETIRELISKRFEGIKIPDNIGEILFPRVKFERIHGAYFNCLSFQYQNVIQAPIVCEYGYKYFDGKCRRVFSLPDLIRSRIPRPSEEE